MTEFDYIIVGAGSAGCVLANRLSANPGVSILLLEAGLPDSSLMISMPKGFAKLIEDKTYVRQFATTHEQGSGVRSETWPRGVMLGGSSSLNGMHYSRGQPRDFDDWAAQGCAGWGWDEISRCYRELEDHELGPDGVRGAGGPLRITRHAGRNPLDEATIAAGADLGVPVRDDVNRPDQDGIGYMMRTIRDGKRESASAAFLRPIANRSNLTVMTKTPVERVLFSAERRAIGVAARRDGQTTQFTARREVILSAGAVQSPHLLQLSGIGPAAALRSAGIDVLVDRDGVGRNLRDHWAAMIQYRVNGPFSNNREFSGFRLVKNALTYLITKKGLMADSPHEVTGYVRSRAGLDRPDVQIFGGPFSLTRADEAGKFDFDKADGMQICAYQMRPESQGTVTIASPDPLDQPTIRPRYLATECDRATAVSMVRFVRKMFAQAPLRKYVEEETLPGSEAQTDEEIVASVRRTGTCLYHAVGTCRMGADDGSVVDAALRVRGVTGLRVVDGSVMPTLVSGFTNGPVMAMAWRAAELIRA